MFQAQVGQTIRSYDFNADLHDRCADYIEGVVIATEGEMIKAVMYSRVMDGDECVDDYEDKTFTTAQNGSMMLDDSHGDRIFIVME